MPTFSTIMTNLQTARPIERLPMPRSSSTTQVLGSVLTECQSVIECLAILECLWSVRIESGVHATDRHLLERLLHLAKRTTYYSIQSALLTKYSLAVIQTLLAQKMTVFSTKHLAQLGYQTQEIKTGCIGRGRVRSLESLSPAASAGTSCEAVASFR